MAAQTARRSHAELERAARLVAVRDERERLSRQVHDGVMQVLALVACRGREIGRATAELAELAGEQERGLRRLVSTGESEPRVSAGALAGEIGRGTMDLIASRPGARSAQVAAAALGMVGGLAVIALAGWAGTAVGLQTRQLEGVAAPDLLPVAGMALLLFASAGCVALFVSATRREGGAAVSWCAGLLAGSYVLDYLARVWSAIAFLRPLSLFRYYEPQRILREGVAVQDIAVLAAVGAAGLVLAFAVFARRDV